MAKPKVDPKTRPVAVRMRKLLEELDLTQEQVADKARELKGKLTRNDVNKVCTGLNQATTEKIRGGLALGTGLHRVDLNDYIDGRLSLDDLLRRRIRSATATEEASNGLEFGQLDGWSDAEKEAAETAQQTGATLTPLDFAGARLMKAFGVPPKLTPRFVAAVAWIWSQTATEEMRQEARRLLHPTEPPSSGHHRSAMSRSGR